MKTKEQQRAMLVQQRDQAAAQLRDACDNVAKCCHMMATAVTAIEHIDEPEHLAHVSNDAKEQFENLQGVTNRLVNFRATISGMEKMIQKLDGKG